jgi:hypothetical protein
MTRETARGVPDISGTIANDMQSRPVLPYLGVMVMILAILSAPGMTARAQQLLSQEEIESQIIGQRFQGKKGILSVFLHYGRDGSVTLRSPIGAGAGRWTLADNRLCVDLSSGPRKANECLTFIHHRDGTYRASNGLRLTRMK